MRDDVRVEHDAQEHRYIARSSDGTERGELVYAVPRPGIVDLEHTEVAEEARGLGVGDKLVRAALADARASGAHVVPTCRFVRRWLDAHPDERAG